MKKYVKPDLYYEDFELSTHIASCDFFSDFNKGECSAGNGIFTVLTEAIGCEDSDYEGYCIENSSLGLNIFRS